MALWRLYYHVIWGTKNRHPLITADLEPKLYEYIIGKADSLKCITHAVGGIEDHIHLAVSIPPKLSIADFVKKLKGSSSHFMGQEKSFAWQRGCGAFSLGGKQLDTAVNYVRRQKQHHKNGSLIRMLEETEE